MVLPRFVCLLVISSLSLVVPAMAGTVVFSNLVQPGNQYGPDGVGIGHTPAFPPGDSYLIYAVPFRPSATVTLDSIEAPLGVVSGPNQLQALLLSDTGGVPGAVLESYVLPNVALPPGPFPLMVIPSAANTLLVGGQQYWFAVTGGATTFGSWTLNLFQGDPSDGGAATVVTGGIPGAWTVGTGHRTGALEVSGTAVVPEPGTAVVVGCALLAGGLLLRRIRV